MEATLVFPGAGPGTYPSMEEREVQHDPQVIEGEDDIPRQPSMSKDPYTPEPGPSDGERRAFRLLPLVWIVVAILAGIILYAVFT